MTNLQSLFRRLLSGGFVRARWAICLLVAATLLTSFPAYTLQGQQPTARAQRQRRQLARRPQAVSAITRVKLEETPYSRFATLKKIKIFYQSYGKGPKALVLIHGWACDLTFWTDQLPAVVGKMRVIALDLPGHGKSDKPQNVDYTENFFAESVNAVLKDAGVDQAVLLGHSLGAYVARQFYRNFTNKTLAIGIVDAHLQKPLLPTLSLDLLVDALDSSAYKIVASLFIDALYLPHTPADLRRTIKRRMLETPNYVMADAMYWLGEKSLYDTDRIEVPVFAVYEKFYLPKDNELFMRRFICQLDYHVWSGIGHFLMMIRPNEFNRDFLDFLAAYKLTEQLQSKSQVAVKRRCGPGKIVRRSVSNAGLRAYRPRVSERLATAA